MTLSVLSISLSLLLAQDPFSPDVTGAAVTPGKVTGIQEPPPDLGNPWFPKTRLELGSFFKEEEAHGRFTFTNPTDVEHKLSGLMASCACAKAVIRVGDRKYVLDKDPVANSLHRVTELEGQTTRERVSFITVGPKQQGEIEVFVDMHGVRGTKDASIDFQTTDPQLAHGKLNFSAVGAVVFEVTPPDVNLNEMTWRDQRQFTFEITSPLKPDFNITGWEANPPDAVKLSYEKTARDGKTVWRVSGTYGPNADERASGSALTFKTDLDGQSVETRIIAYVKGPLTVEPGGFLSLGHIPSSSGTSRTVKLSPTDDFDLQVTSVELQDLRVPDGAKDKVKVEAKKAGNAVEV
jgi:hypothetical protein